MKLWRDVLTWLTVSSCKFCNRNTHTRALTLILRQSDAQTFRVEFKTELKFEREMNLKFDLKIKLKFELKIGLKNDLEF